MNKNQSTEIVITPEVLPTDRELVDGTVDYANAVYEEATRYLGEAEEQGRRAWMCYVVLGAVLVKIKEECPHGEFSKFFPDAEKRLKSNETCVSHFNFNSRSASRYMKLYKKLAEKGKRKLGKEEAALLEVDYITECQRADIYEVLDKLSTAASLKQVFEDEGVTKVKSKSEQMLENRAKDGGKTQEQPSPEEALAEARELATAFIMKTRAELETFSDQERYALVDREELAGFLDLLTVTRTRVQEALRNGEFLPDDGEEDGLPEVNVLGRK